MMLKKLLSGILVVIMAFTVVGCSGEKSSQTMGTNTDVSTESNTELNDTSNTQPTNPSTIPESTPNSTGNENGATSSTVVSRPNNGTVSSTPGSTTSSKPNSGTVSSKPNSGTTSSKPSTSTPVSKEPYLVSLELIKTIKPNAIYLSNGMDAVEYAYGKDYLQCGDSFVFKVNMSDGGSDFDVQSYSVEGCTYTRNGNVITATVDGSDTYACVRIEAKNKNGEWITKDMKFNVAWRTHIITESPGSFYCAFIAYAERKGISHTNSGSKVDHYTKYDLSLSLTNSKIKGNDDMFYFSDYPKVTDFAEKVFWLIDQYEKKGFTLWSMLYGTESVGIVAGHPYK